MRFDWDPDKASRNLRKHGVSFEEAQSVFYDEFAVQFLDAEHSDVEERFIMPGMSHSARLLVVVHCERCAGEVIRITSARKATASEAKHYQKVSSMKAEYDFSKMKARKNPYASKLKRPVTMRLSEDVVAYFKAMAKEAGVPYQTLINLYLRDCLAQNRRIQVRWPSAG